MVEFKGFVHDCEGCPFFIWAKSEWQHEPICFLKELILDREHERCEEHDKYNS